MDVTRLKANFALVAGSGVSVAEYFYADLFARSPAVREMFPASMERQHEKLLGALAHIVGNVTDEGELVPYLQQLGREHRGFGVLAEHYPAVGASLIATLAHFSGGEWSEELEGDWLAAFGVVSSVMQDA